MQVTLTPFQTVAGQALPDAAVSLWLVDYVPAIGHLDPTKQRRRWPDVLRPWPPEGLTLSPGENRVLWISVQVPKAAAPGLYEAELALTTKAEGFRLTLPLRLVVHALSLPDPCAFRFRVDFWQAFGRLARVYGVQEWSEDWWAIVRAFVEDLAAHGQDVVQVGRGHFDWIRRADGQWRFGFERFDRYVELCAAAGIEGLIEYLQMFDGRGDTTIYYIDEAGRSRSAKSNPGEPLFDEVWVAFAKALAAHCREKGWLDRLYICPTDEPQDVYGPPTLARFKHCRRLLRQADPALRVTCALDSLRSAKMLAGEIDRFVFKLREDVYDPAFAKELREQGKLVETYICCHPDYPNSFITSEAIEQRVIGWLCWQEQFQGLLRWSYVNWPEDVWNKPEGDGRYAPGDYFIVYPGDKKPLPSTRWERLRDGFEDYEMLRLAEETIRKSRSPRKAVAQAAYEQALAEIAGPPGKLTQYTRDPERLLSLRAALLEALDPLL